MAEVGTRPSYENVDRKVEVLDTPYDRWISSQGIDVIRGFFVDDLYTIPLKWWDRFGGNGVYIMLDGTGYMDRSKASNGKRDGKREGQCDDLF